MEPTINNDRPGPIPLRILFLHGFTQTPQLFRAKTGALTKALQKAFPTPKYHLQLSFPQGPHRLAPADIPGFNPSALDLPPSEAPGAWGWWRRKDYTNTPSTSNSAQPTSSSSTHQPEIIYEGLERSLDDIAELICEEGPFDGVIGFSQGAALAAMLAALLEPGRREEFERAGGTKFPDSFDSLIGCDTTSPPDHEGEGKESKVLQPPLKFVIAYSGFRSPGPRYAGFYEPKIQTPILHMLGAVDVVVEEARARLLVQACEWGEERVVVHPGGHFVPSQRVWVDAAVGFVRECVEGDGAGGKTVGKVEERVEDMEMPF